VKLVHINVRTEKHGKNDVDAADFDFSYKTTNSTVLGLLHPHLCAALFYNPDADDGQQEVEGLPPVLPKLRFPRLGALPWAEEVHGVDLTVHYGLGDDESNIEFSDGKVVLKRVELEDGTAELFFQFRTAAVPDGALDKLRKKLKQGVEVTVVQNERLRTSAVERTDAIDGTTAAFERDHPGAGEGDATDLFSQTSSEGGAGPEDDDGGSEGGEPDAGSDASDDAPPVVTRSTRTARGREKTKKALASGVH
jgi:hypothetical protein